MDNTPNQQNNTSAQPQVNAKPGKSPEKKSAPIKILNQAQPFSVTQIIGAITVALGILTFICCGIYECVKDGDADQSSVSSLMSIAFLLTMLGMAFFFPTMLKSGPNDNTSSMRVVVYMIVSVFVFLCVKIGWNSKSFSEFKLDSSWAYILGIALGSKAVQSFSENRPTSGSTRSLNAGVPATAAGIHDPSIINNPPPATPPKFITG